MLKNKTCVIRKKASTCYKCLLSILLIANCYISSAQNESEIGLPFIKNYYPKDYNANPQTWAVIDDSTGLMYFGVQGGIIVYDGVKWERVSFPSANTSTLVRSFAKDKHGTIYYGAYGDFGYLKNDSLGQTIAISLLKYVPQEARHFFDVWTINISDRGIYFQSREEIIRLQQVESNGEENWKVKAWKPRTMFMYAFYPDDTYYVHQQGLGLYKMADDSLVLIPGSEFLGKERVQVMLPYTSPGEKQDGGKKKYLFGMFYSGLYLFDGNTFSPFKTEADPMIKSGLVLYKGIRLKNGNFALSSTGAGLVIIDPNGKLIRKINRAVGLQDESVYAVYVSKDGTLWLALDNGISRVEMGSPLTQFTLQSGISTSVLSVARYNGSLYVGTTNGLLKYNNSKGIFELNKTVPQNQIFSLLPEGNELLIAGDGLFVIRGEKTSLIQSSLSGNLTLNSLYIPPGRPDLLLGGSASGITVFQKNKNSLEGDGSWVFTGLIPGITDQVWTFAGDNEGTVWAGTQNNIVFRLRFTFDEKSQLQLAKTRVEKFGSENGLKNAAGAVFRTKQKAFFLHDSGVYSFNNQQRRFVNDTTFGIFNHGGGNDDGFVFQDSLSRVWVRLGKETRLAIPRSDGGYKVTKVLQPLSDRTFSTILSEKNGITWICTTDGLVRYDEKMAGDSTYLFQTLLRHVTAGTNILDPDPAKDQVAEIDNKNNTLRFQYAAPFFEQEDKTQYQTWLEGFEKNWSDFDNNYYKEYTNLPPGRLSFSCTCEKYLPEIK